MKRSVLASAIGGLWLVAQGAAAARGDFSLDFTAAEPTSYNHFTGGGAYNDRTINKDVVESLEAGNFACGDTVTFLTRIAVDDRAEGSQSLTIGFDFTAHSTGHQGVAFVDNIERRVSRHQWERRRFGNGRRRRKRGDARSAASWREPERDSIRQAHEVLQNGNGQRPEAGETVVLRTDVRIVCNGEHATGNLQARLFTPDGGKQTIPLRHVGDIQPPPTK